ncbi:hypothetical protein OROMI_002691 [Orobanche minor]
MVGKKPNLINDERNTIVHFLLHNCTNGKPNRGRMKEAATKYGVTRRIVSYLWAAAKKQMEQRLPIFLISKKAGCVKLKKRVEVPLELIMATSIFHRSTIRRLAISINVKKTTVGRWVLLGLIKAHSNAIKHYLTAPNKLLRLKFSLSNLQFDRLHGVVKFKSMHNIIHIDKKWFNLTTTSRKVYLGKGEEDPHRTIQSKKHIPKVMFMCAVGRPCYSIDGELIFDGKIGMFPFTKQEGAQRNSKNRARGTLETKPINSITKDVIKHCLIHQIIPSIKEKWPPNASKDIIIQQDNDRPHISNEDPEFRAAASSDGFNIVLMQQPANSPDTNVNDLSWFRALQSLHMETGAYNIDELVNAVAESFEKMEPSKLNTVFLSLQQCMLEIMKVKGQNNYKLPHMGKDRLERLGLLLMVLEVDELTVRECIEYLVQAGLVGGSTYDLTNLLADLGY